jgi:hypothetical protein
MHECTLEEVRDRFGSFNGSDRRCRLFEKLEDYVHEAQKTGLVDELLLAGSFVTDKKVPEDIDLVALLGSSSDPATLRPFEYNVVSRRQVRRRWRLDIFFAQRGTTEFDRAVALFQQVRGESAARKGLLRLRL